jgi:hypothetical protein
VHFYPHRSEIEPSVSVFVSISVTYCIYRYLRHLSVHLHTHLSEYLPPLEASVCIDGLLAEAALEAGPFFRILASTHL